MIKIHNTDEATIIEYPKSMKEALLTDGKYSNEELVTAMYRTSLCLECLAKEARKRKIEWDVDIPWIASSLNNKIAWGLWNTKLGNIREQ